MNNVTRQFADMKINPKGKLQHMTAPDMFEGDRKQVFNAKTGKWMRP